MACPARGDAVAEPLPAEAQPLWNGFPRGKEPNPTYTSYLALDRVLNSQFPRSRAANDERHDEHLFIIVHQAYELWFKQIIHDVDSIIRIFQSPSVDDRALSLVEQRLGRVNEILVLLAKQFRVLLTMLPHQFLGFRRFLGTSSGFQSLQFRTLELKLGLLDDARVPFAQGYREQLGSLADTLVAATPGCPSGGGSLVNLVDAWLSRMPFMRLGNFDWWREYEQAALKSFDDENQRALSEPNLTDTDRASLRQQTEQTKREFSEVFDEEKWNKRAAHHRLSYPAFKAALLIALYRDEPIFQMPHLVLVRLIEIDEGLSQWRWSHMQMVKRILGSKLGTGGSSGAAYLGQTITQRYRVFADLSMLSTFMIPAENLPALPREIATAMGFAFSAEPVRAQLPTPPPKL